MIAATVITVCGLAGVLWLITGIRARRVEQERVEWREYLRERD